MRRVLWMLAGLPALLLLGAALVVYGAPHRLANLLEAALARRAAPRVQVERLELTRSARAFWLDLEVEGARVAPLAGGALTADVLRVAWNPLYLLVGRVRLGDAEVRGARFRLPAETEGARIGDPAEVIAGLVALSARLRDARCTTDRLRLSDFALVQARANAADAPRVSAVHGSVECLRGERRADAELAGTLHLGAHGAPAFQINAHAETGEVQARVEVEPFTLALPARDVQTPTASAVRAKTAADDATAPGERAKASASSAQSEGAKVAARDAQTPTSSAARAEDASRAKSAVPPQRVRMQMNARVTREAFTQRVEFFDAATDAVFARAESSLALPFTRASPLRASLTLHALEASALAHWLALLPRALAREVQPLARRFERGRLDAVRVELDSSAAGLRELFAQGPFARPGALTATARVQGGVFRVGAAERVTEISGEAHFDGDAIILRGLRARFAGAVLAELDLTLRGITQLSVSARSRADGFHCEPTQAVPPLPGLHAYNHWRASRRQVGVPPGWQRMRIELDFVSHPLLFCTLRAAHIVLTPHDDSRGMDFEAPRARWGGLPIAVRGVFRRPSDAERRLSVAVQLGAPDAAPALPELPVALTRRAQFENPTEAAAPASAPERNLEAAAAAAARAAPRVDAEPWARGRFEAQTTQLGAWRATRAGGSVRAAGTRLYFDDLTLQLTPAETVRGVLMFEFGTPHAAHYDAGLQFEANALPNLWSSLGAPRAWLTGTLHGALTLRGPLHLGESLMAAASGAVALSARDGVVERSIPLLLAIALASDRFNPLRDRDKLRYDALDLFGRFEDGALVAESATLLSPVLRSAITGRARLHGEGALDLGVGLFFFPRVDDLVSKIPLLNRVILGGNNNLLGAYFAVTGTLREPEARLVPIESLVRGPTGVVLEMPMRILGVMQDIQSALTPDAPSKNDAPQEDAP